MKDGCGGVRCVDIAEALHCSKPSVYAMMRRFKEMNLVKKARYGTVFLTEEEKTLAARYAICFARTYVHFEHVFCLPEAQAKNVAYRMLSQLSQEYLKTVCIKIKQ